MVAIAVLMLLAAPGRAQVQVFFFNPDIGVQDLNLLVTAANKYFTAMGERVQLRPFARPEDLEAQLGSARPPFVIVSSWYLAQAKDAKLTPLLMPAVGAETNYKKSVVVQSGRVAEIGALDGRVATTSLGQNSAEFLDEFVLSGTGVESAGLNIIWVRKELDALMALRQNQVQASIVADKNYEMIKQLSPGTVQGLEIIHTSKPIPESPLCATAHAGADDQSRIKELFLKMHEHEDGQAFLTLLGYDKWVEDGLDSL